MKFVWHYTPWSKLSIIVESGYLHPSNIGASAEQPLLWFSSRQDYEPTAIKVIRDDDGTIRQLTFDEQVFLYGLVRFGLPETDPRLLRWNDACRVGQISMTQKRVMEKRGKQRKSTHANWFALVESLPLTGMAFNVFLDGKWRSASDLRGMAHAWERNHEQVV